MNAIVEKIKAAYELEHQLNREAVSEDELPLSFQEITPRWLTAILCGKVRGAEVLSVKLGPVDNGSSNRRRLHIEYNHEGTHAKLPTAIFCKATHDLANRIVLGVSGGGICEANFYNQIRPLLPIEAPVPYFARFDEETYNSMIMLGDLSDTVTEFCNHNTNMTRARAESQMRLLGKLHGACYGHEILSRRLGIFPTFKEFFACSMQFGLREGTDAGFLAAREVIPARLYARHAEIWDATIAAVDEGDRLPNTLSHGDVHLKNWYVAGSGEMGLSDWQCCGRAHWGRDVAYAISCALTVENRRLWERDLLSLYLDEMHRAGGPKIAFDDAWTSYRAQIVSALAWWTVTLCPPPGLPDMQPRDITIEFIKRIATAMDDVDTLALFKA